MGKWIWFDAEKDNNIIDWVKLSSQLKGDMNFEAHSQQQYTRLVDDN